MTKWGKSKSVQARIAEKVAPGLKKRTDYFKRIGFNMTEAEIASYNTKKRTKRSLRVKRDS